MHNLYISIIYIHEYIVCVCVCAHACMHVQKLMEHENLKRIVQYLFFPDFKTFLILSTFLP